MKRLTIAASHYYCLLPTSYHLLLTTYYLLLSAHYLLLSAHYLLISAHYLLLSAHYSLLTIAASVDSLSPSPSALELLYVHLLCAPHTPAMRASASTTRLMHLLRLTRHACIACIDAYAHLSAVFNTRMIRLLITSATQRIHFGYVMYPMAVYHACIVQHMYLPTYYMLHATCYILHTACYTLHTACYILHTTYCILHTAYCMLHTA